MKRVDNSSFVQFKLRIRQNLRCKLEQAAKKGDRSVNNEAVARLERQNLSIPDAGGVTP